MDENAAYQPVRLPRGWQVVDAAILRVTEIVLVVVGIAFTAMLCLDVVARYVFDFSLFVINSAALFLLVWFLLLGAGVALRQGAHVGFVLMLERLPRAIARALLLLSQTVILVFCGQMLWSGWSALEPASFQTEAALEISMLWVMLAFPVGFALLIYHQIVLMLSALRAPAS